MFDDLPEIPAADPWADTGLAPADLPELDFDPDGPLPFHLPDWPDWPLGEPIPFDLTR